MRIPKKITPKQVALMIKFFAPPAEKKEELDFDPNNLPESGKRNPEPQNEE